MEKMIKHINLEIERLQAINEIQNLMSKMECLAMANRNYEVVDLFAKKHLMSESPLMM